jgi:HEAT repeat protein
MTEFPGGSRPSWGPWAGSGLGDEEAAAVRTQVGTFTVALLKTLLQTASFGTAHEATRRVVLDFMESFGLLPESVHEISYVAASVEAKPEIQVEGVAIDALPLRACLKPLLRDEFVGKLHRFFEYHRLISMSLRRDVDPDEFVRFLDLSRRGASVIPPAGGEPQRLPRLSEVLLEHGVAGIGVVCRDDLLFGARTVPWRVRVALSRLSKNLRGVPFYARATRRALVEARARLVGDIIRPLASRELLLELLLNCDLVEEAAATEGLDLEDEILRTLRRSRLIAVLPGLAAEATRPAAAGREDDRRGSARRVLRKAMPYATDVLDEDIVALFRRLVADGLLKLDELPLHVQRSLRGEEMAEHFLAAPQATLGRIRAARDVAAFRGFAAVIALLVAELIKRHEHGWARGVVDALVEHAAERSDRPPMVRELAREALDAIGVPANLQRVVADLPQVAVSAREDVVHLVDLFPDAAASALVTALEQEGDVRVRRAIASLLQRLGDRAGPHVRAGLAKTGQDPAYYRDLLLVLAAHPDPAARQRVQLFVGHQLPAVREAAFQAVGTMGGEEADRLLRQGLEDVESDVRRAALLALARMGCRDDAFVQYLVGAVDTGRTALGTSFRELVGGRRSEGRRQKLRLQAAAAAALTGLVEAGVVLPEGFDLEAITALDQILRISAADGAEEADERRESAMALIGLLRKLKSERALDMLRKARKDDDLQVATSAGAAIGELRAGRRSTMPPPGSSD